jgi:hypothetical protein
MGSMYMGDLLLQNEGRELLTGSACKYWMAPEVTFDQSDYCDLDIDLEYYDLEEERTCFR